MECLVANVEGIKFDIETALDEQHGALPLPFPGMDSKYSYISQYINSTKLTHNTIVNARQIMSY